MYGGQIDPRGLFLSFRGKANVRAGGAFNSEHRTRRRVAARGDRADFPHRPKPGNL